MLIQYTHKFWVFGGHVTGRCQGLFPPHLLSQGKAPWGRGWRLAASPLARLGCLAVTLQKKIRNFSQSTRKRNGLLKRLRDISISVKSKTPRVSDWSFDTGPQLETVEMRRIRDDCLVQEITHTNLMLLKSIHHYKINMSQSQLTILFVRIFLDFYFFSFTFMKAESPQKGN